jgi:ribonuclease P protein component
MTTEPDQGGEAQALRPPFRLSILKTRPLFKAASAGPRYSTDGFTMQRRLPAPGEALAETRFGFTVTKKIGMAVLRNRIRRRLREAVRRAGPDLPDAPLDLVIIARGAAATLPFERLVADIGRAAAALAKRDRPSTAAKSREKR